MTFMTAKEARDSELKEFGLLEETLKQYFTRTPQGVLFYAIEGGKI